MKRYAIILLLVFPIILCGCFDSEDKIVAEYEYRVEITPINNTPFIIYIPFPIDIKNNDKPSTIIYNKIDITPDNTEYNLEETEKEIALKVIGTNNIILESKGDFFNKDDMSTFISLHKLDETGNRKESGTTSFWVYSNINGTIKIKYHLEEISYPHLLRDYEISGNMTPGWSLIQGDIKSEVA